MEELRLEIKHVMAMIALAQSALSHTTGNSPATAHTLFERPAAVQMAVDKAFLNNSVKNADTWLYNGSYKEYGLLDCNDENALKHLLDRTLDKKDIYIIDAGCAQGAWGRHALHMLHDHATTTGQRVHIFSLTGGQECPETVTIKDNVTLYQFNRFKIENIDKELQKRGFNLENKVDLIVSKWTLHHLVDPFGTLKRMYSLLSSRNGALVSNGFLFAFDHSEKVQSFPNGNWNLLAQGTAIPLFKVLNLGYAEGEFLLVRTTAHELSLPLEYTGETRRIGPDHQCSSEVVTVFKKKLIAYNTMQDQHHRLDSNNFLSHYCDKDNERSKKLFNYLYEKELLKASPLLKEHFKKS